MKIEKIHEEVQQRKEENEHLRGAKLKLLKAMNYWMAWEEREKQMMDEERLNHVWEESHLINHLKKKIVWESEEKGTEKLWIQHEQRLL